MYFIFSLMNPSLTPLLQSLTVALGILFLSLSATILYKIVERTYNKRTKISDLSVALACFSVFFNPFIVEWFLFFDVAVMTFGVFCAMLGTYLLLSHDNSTTRRNWLLAVVLFVISAFAYQSSPGIGAAVLTLFLLARLREKKTIRKDIRSLLLAISPFLIGVVINFVFVKIMNLNISDPRTQGSINPIYNLLTGIKYFNHTALYAYGFIPRLITIFMCLIISVIFMTNIYLSRTTRKEKVFTVTISALAIFAFYILAIFAPLGMSSDRMYFMPRNTPFTIALFSFMFITFIILDKKFAKSILASIMAVAWFILTAYSTITLQMFSSMTNMLDIREGQTILHMIDQHENENQAIKNIVLLPDTAMSMTHPNIPWRSDITIRAFDNDWSTRSILNFLTPRRFNITTGNAEQKENVFGSLEADQFDRDTTLVFVGDTLYILVY